MTSRRLRFTLALAATLIVAAPAFAAEKRHQFLEPIQSDRQQEEEIEGSATGGKICYCRTLHEKGATGQITWRVACSEQPDQGARKIRADDCGAIRNLSHP
ncbi:hypothetical protein [Pleomorphomonas sp. PLEO]|uniref:hypothetical protein n=1 Tax=Pleomorphomonas sp. PLEO TaxID=3239306 RepID=UPI00351E9CB2